MNLDRLQVGGFLWRILASIFRKCLLLQSKKDNACRKLKSDMLYRIKFEI